MSIYVNICRYCIRNCTGLVCRCGCAKQSGLESWRESVALDIVRPGPLRPVLVNPRNNICSTLGEASCKLQELQYKLQDKEMATSSFSTTPGHTKQANVRFRAPQNQATHNETEIIQSVGSKWTRKSEGDGAHWKPLSRPFIEIRGLWRWCLLGSAMEIGGRWRP